MEAVLVRRALVLMLTLAASLAACGTTTTVPVGPTSATSGAPAATSSASEAKPVATGSSGVLSRDSLHGTIAYSSDDGGNDDVYLLRLDGSEPIRLTDGPEKEFDPDLSPDGTRIAYRRNPRADSDAADIWLMSVDGSDKRTLTNDPERSNWAPAWTPDGRIAFARMSEPGGPLELWTMRDDGTDLRRVGEGWCEYADPSPDGTQYACAAATGGHYDIVVVDAATGARRPVTATSSTEFGPSWSPDGRWIAYSRDLGTRWALLVARPDGTEEHEVAPEGVFSTWDPDGHLAWSGPGGINVAEPDGSGRIALDYPAAFMSWAGP